MNPVLVPLQNLQSDQTSKTENTQAYGEMRQAEALSLTQCPVVCLSLPKNCAAHSAHSLLQKNNVTTAKIIIFQNKRKFSRHENGYSRINSITTQLPPSV